MGELNSLAITTRGYVAEDIEKHKINEWRGGKLGLAKEYTSKFLVLPLKTADCRGIRNSH